MPIKNLDKVWEKSYSMEIKQSDGIDYLVLNPDSQVIYNVRLTGSLENGLRKCNCEYGMRNDIADCSHVIAAARHRVEQLGYNAVWLVAPDFDYKEQGADGLFQISESAAIMTRKIHH